MSVLDDQCNFPKSTDQSFSDTLRERIRTARFRFRPGPHKDFVIEHYAGPVTYDCSGFLDKNRDTISVDLVHALEASSAAVCKSLLPYVQARRPRTPFPHLALSARRSFLTAPCLPCGNCSPSVSAARSVSAGVWRLCEIVRKRVGLRRAISRARTRPRWRAASASSCSTSWRASTKRRCTLCGAPPPRPPALSPLCITSPGGSRPEAARHGGGLPKARTWRRASTGSCTRQATTDCQHRKTLNSPCGLVRSHAGARAQVHQAQLPP